jgi:threonine dehydrogenase-like Zn-dependent dehydrogenase
VVVVGQNFGKLHLALTMGTIYVNNVDEVDIELAKQGVELEKGFDIVLEMSGNRCLHRSKEAWIYRPSSLNACITRNLRRALSCWREECRAR